MQIKVGKAFFECRSFQTFLESPLEQFSSFPFERVFLVPIQDSDSEVPSTTILNVNRRHPLFQVPSSSHDPLRKTKRFFSPPKENMDKNRQKCRSLEEVHESPEKNNNSPVTGAEEDDMFPVFVMVPRGNRMEVGDLSGPSMTGDSSEYPDIKLL